MRPGAKARVRGQLAVPKFEPLGKLTWAKKELTPAPSVTAGTIDSESRLPAVQASSNAASTGSGLERRVERPNRRTETPLAAMT